MLHLTLFYWWTNKYVIVKIILVQKWVRRRGGGCEGERGYESKAVLLGLNTIYITQILLYPEVDRFIICPYIQNNNFLEDCP